MKGRTKLLLCQFILVAGFLYWFQHVKYSSFPKKMLRVQQQEIHLQDTYRKENVEHVQTTGEHVQSDLKSFIKIPKYAPSDVNAILNQPAVQSVGKAWNLTHAELDKFFLTQPAEVQKAARKVDASRAIEYYLMVKMMDELKIHSIDKLLSVNGGGIENYFLESMSREVVSYAYRRSTGEGDLHDMSALKDTDIDFAFCPQTLEHLYNPIQALQEINKHLKVGGYLATHQPFINRPHMSPIHFSQFTGYGVTVLLAQAGFKVVAYRDWGNDLYTTEVLVRRKWPPYQRLSDLNTERNRYAQTLFIAQKVAERPLVRSDFD